MNSSALILAAGEAEPLPVYLICHFAPSRHQTARCNSGKITRVGAAGSTPVVCLLTTGGRQIPQSSNHHTCSPVGGSPVGGLPVGASPVGGSPVGHKRPDFPPCSCALPCVNRMLPCVSPCASRPRSAARPYHVRERGRVPVRWAEDPGEFQGTNVHFSFLCVLVPPNMAALCTHTRRQSSCRVSCLACCLQVSGRVRDVQHHRE